MKQYFPLALSLALGEARAEEPKECIDKVVISVNIPFIGDAITRYFNGANKSEKEEFLGRLAKPTRNLYTKTFGLPIEFFDQKDHQPHWWHRYERKHPNTLLINAEYGRFVYGANCGEADLDKNLIRFVSCRFVHDWYYGNGSGYKDMTYLYADESTILEETDPMGEIIAHEIGHFFGLENNNDPAENNKVNIMAASSNDIINQYTEYYFTEKDKAKILSQLCKPEESK